MEIEKKRERKANFSDEEVRCLLEGIRLENEAINSKLQGTMTARRKKEAWDRICLRVNAMSNSAKRSHEEIKRKWKDLKSAVLKEKVHQTKTGGGGPMKEPPFKDMILDIIGDKSDAVSGIASGTDSFLTTIQENLLEIVEFTVEESCQLPATQNIPDPSTSLDNRQSEELLSDQPATDSVGLHFLTSSLLASTPNASNRHRNKKRRQTSTSRDDEVLSGLLTAKERANSIQEECTREKIEVMKLQKQKLQLEIDDLTDKRGANSVQKELALEQLELVRLEKRKVLLEIQALESQRN